MNSRSLFLILSLGMFAFVISQKTDFGTYCYAPQSCSDDNDCNGFSTCNSGICTNSLPGAPCNATAGCNTNIGICRGSVCTLTNGGGKSQFAGCACNAQSGCSRLQKCVSGTCQNGKNGINDNCDNDEDCLSTLWCDSNSCAAKVALNISCNTNSQCLSGYCGNAICKNKVATGQVCTSQTDCLTGFCLYNMSGDGICGAGLPIGADCYVNRYACLSGACSENGGVNFTCVAKLALNQTCYSDTACNSGICINNICVAQRLPLGASCNGQNNICASGYCSGYNQSCATVFGGALGATCNNFYDCDSLFCGCDDSGCNDRSCRIPFNKTAGQDCFDQSQCAFGYECAGNDKCVLWGAGNIGSPCGSTRACNVTQKLYCNSSSLCDIDTKDSCIAGVSCAYTDICNCTSAANFTNMCVPAPQGTVNILAYFPDVNGKDAYCQQTYMAPLLRSSFPAQCDGYSFLRGIGNTRACEMALANTACCTSCGASLVIGFGDYEVDCSTLTLRNSTATCSGYPNLLKNCDQWPPVNSTTTSTTTNTDSPAVRLNAILMFVLVAIVFVVSF